MSEDTISETQKLEMQYAELLKKKTQFMAQEVTAYEEQASKKLEETKAKEAEEAKEAQYLAFKEKMAKEYKLDPTPSLDPMANSGSPTQTSNPKMMVYKQYHDEYLKSKGIENVYGYGSPAHLMNIDPAGGNVSLPANFNPYAFTDSDSQCQDDVDAWSPADYYCSMVWHAAQNYGQLAGKVTVGGCDISAGNGGVAQIRTLSARTSRTTLSLSQGCSCISCTSNTFSTYTATIDIYGAYSVICDIDEFRIGSVYKPAVIESMARDLAYNKDRVIWTQLLSPAKPGQSVTLQAVLGCAGVISSGANSCCSLASNLYASIIRLEAQMRESGYFGEAEPILIMSPTVAAILKYKEALNSPAWFDSSFVVENGLLKRIGNINIIEYGDAPSCSGTSGVTFAIMIDPTRAVSEFYGKHPTWKEDDDPIECLSYKLVLHEYVAIDDLDPGAIGHIVAP